MSQKVALTMRLWLVLMTLMLTPIAAEAQVMRLRSANLTPYEQNHIFRAAAQQRLKLDVDYRGQTIQFVRIHRYPVFVDFEQLPTLLNAVHSTSKDGLVRRELLVKPKDPFDELKILESVRNLRRLGIFNLVAALPAYDPQKKAFGLLVVTRDLWSLRLESNFQFTGATIDRLNAQLTERNLFGWGKTALLRYGLFPLEYSTGAFYLDPRVGGKQLRLQVGADTIFRRANHSYNGFQTTIGVSRPFYNLGQRWGFNTFLSMTNRDQQVEEAGVIQGYPYRTHSGVVRIPMQWTYRSVSTEALARLQLGKRFLFRMSFGGGVRDFETKTGEELKLDEYDDVIVEHFLDTVVPDSFRWVYPALTMSFFQNRYRIVRNLAGYALSEDVPLGPSAFASVRAPLSTLGSTENLLVLGSHLTWRELLFGDGLFEVGGAMSGWYRVDEDDLDNKSLLLRLRLASPTLGFGRLVSRVDWLSYLEPESVVQVSLGGDNGLRGYPSQMFNSLGGARLRSNVEYRSPSWAMAQLRFGAVAFYDSGMLYDGSEETGYLQSVGMGLRMVIPQASRFAYRLDVGIPVDGSGFMVSISGETNQAVPLLPYEDRVYDGLFSVGGLVNQP